MRKGVQKMRKIKSFMAVLLSLVMMGTMPGAVSSITAYGAQTSESEDTATLAAASGLGVASHTQEEIINHIKDSGALITDDTVYKTDYSAEQPYSAGVLAESTLNSGIAMLNNIRYIAGLNYDVALDDGFNEECQAGALINKINGSISHYPQQPSDMSDEMYQLAYKGCNESNIAWGYSTLNKCIVFGWMSDDDDGNISRVGHRAWCLNPTMGKTGFGVVDNYYNMHSFDGSHTSSVKNISWPAQNMPVEYFEKNMPWSIFTGSSETASDVKVTLTRQSDGKVWNFSQDSADGYFNCTNYIQNGTIVFRPGDITGYNDGDVFTVSVTGVKTPLTYTASFFSLGSDLGHVHTFKKGKLTVNGIDIDAMTADVSLKCDSCDAAFESTGTITNILTDNVTCGFKGYVGFDFEAKIYGVNWQGTNYYYINGLPHKYGDVEFTWDGTACTADAKCSRCGDVVSEKCTVTSKTTATCTADGVTIYTAEYDGKTDTKTVDTPATGHSFTDYVTDNNATCTADGTKTAKCDYGCGATDTIADEGSKVSHKFTNYVPNGDADCTQAGTKTAECDYGCGTTDTIENADDPQKGHSFTKYISNNNATCQADGTKTAKCDYGCGQEDTIADEGSKLDHKFTKYIPNNDATCKNVGTKTAECDYGCGTTDTIENADDPQKEHSFTKYISDNNATCQADGTKTAKCDYDCGTTDTIADKGSKLDHKFTKYVSNNDATCMTDGTKTAKCDYGCGETDTIADKGSKLDHKFTKYVSNGDATCTADGTKTAKCDYGCGEEDTITDEGSKLDHKFTKYVSNDDATCMTDGTKTAKCDYGCGEEDTIADEGSKLDHKFTKYIPNNDATCKNVGTKTAECDYGCGTTDTIENADDPQKEHSFTKYISDNNATCQADGTKTAKCDYDCGEEDTITDEGSKLDHKFTKYVSNNDATCTADGTKTAECDYGCGTIDTIADEGSKVSHKFTKYVSNNDATCTADGTKTAKCDYGCGETDTVVDEGSKLDHKFTKYVSNNDATCTADGTKTAECDYGCGATDTVNNADDPRREHTSSDKWVVSTKATDKADGILVDKCTECGQIIDSKRVPQIEKVKLAYTSCTYDGTAKKPGVTVYDVDGNILNKTNYTVSYKNNTASGAASVTVTFKGNYAGRITATFVIYPKAVSIKTAQSTAKGVKLTWNRAANGTGYIVYRSVNGSSFKKYKTINSLSTISMVDSGAKKSGTKYAYKIYVYKSVNGKVYNSAASAVKLTYYMAAPAWKSLKNSSARAITVKYGNTSGATGYQIQYATAKTFKGAKTLNIAGAKNVSKTVKRLAKNKRYYVRVRSYRKSGKVTYYSAWSTAKNVVIKK